jgi:error-prone DNA polymerase
LKQDELEQLVARRGRGYDSVRDVWLRSGLSASTIERLADIDAFRSLGLDRRDALWAARGLNRVGGQEDLPLFACSAQQNKTPRSPARGEGDFQLPPMLLGEHIVEDYRTLGLSLKAHPCALLRDHLHKGRAIKAETLLQSPNCARTRVAGLVLVRQRPGTASGVIFMTLEDETGIANIVVWPKMFERFRAEVIGGRLVAIDGPVQSESGVIHVIAEHVHDWTPLLVKLSAAGGELDATSRVDEPRRGVGVDPRQLKAQQGPRHPRNARIELNVTPAAGAMPKGRNFH